MVFTDDCASILINLIEGIDPSCRNKRESCTWKRNHLILSKTQGHELLCELSCRWFGGHQVIVGSLHVRNRSVQASGGHLEVLTPSLHKQNIPWIHSQPFAAIFSNVWKYCLYLVSITVFASMSFFLFYTQIVSMDICQCWPLSKHVPLLCDLKYHQFFLNLCKWYRNTTVVARRLEDSQKPSHSHIMHSVEAMFSNVHKIAFTKFRERHLKVWTISCSDTNGMNGFLSTPSFHIS